MTEIEPDPIAAAELVIAYLTADGDGQQRIAQVYTTADGQHRAALCGGLVEIVVGLGLIACGNSTELVNAMRSYSVLRQLDGIQPDAAEGL